MPSFVRVLAAFAVLLSAVPATASELYAVPGTERHDVVSGTGAVYRIMIARPDVEAPAAGFPVIYAVDGNAVFGTLVDILRGAEIRQRLMGAVLGGVEPAVVVAIGYPGDAAYDLARRAVDYTPGDPTDRAGRPAGGADRFLAFIQDVVKPMVARDFPVDPKRQALFGHSYGGLFALHVLFTQPTAFSSYVASSPSLWWNDGYISREEVAFAASAADAPTVARVILSVGEHEQGLSPREYAALPAARADERNRHLRRRAMVDSISALADRLASVPGVDLRFRIHEGETHGTVVPIAYARAMQAAWAD